MFHSPKLRILSDGVSDDVLERLTLKFNLLMVSVPADSVCALYVGCSQSNDKNQVWKFDLSLKMPHCHLGISKESHDLILAVNEIFAEFWVKMETYSIQLNTQLFRLDRTTECDFFDQARTLDANFQVQIRTAMILEDDPAASSILEASLKSLGWGVDCFALPDDALKGISVKVYDLLLLDWNLPYKKGHDFLVEADEILKEQKIKLEKKIPLIICSSLQEGEIEIPNVVNFKLLDTWHKSIPFSSLLNQLDKTTTKVVND